MKGARPIRIRRFHEPNRDGAGLSPGRKTIVPEWFCLFWFVTRRDCHVKLLGKRADRTVRFQIRIGRTRNYFRKFNFSMTLL